MAYQQQLAQINSCGCGEENAAANKRNIENSYKQSREGSVSAAMQLDKAQRSMKNDGKYKT